jgi:hypothetical protein
VRCRGPVLLLLAFAASAPVPAAEPPDWEARLSFDWVQPKSHIRDGTPPLPGSNLYSGSTLGMDSQVPAATLELGARFGDEHLSLSGWWVRSTGVTVLEEGATYAGRVLAAGTPVDSVNTWTSVRLQYLHTFGLATDPDGRAWLSVDAGAAVERTTFQADLAWPGDQGTTSLRGLFPTLQAAVEVRPLAWLSVRAGMGGFRLYDVPNGDTVVKSPVEYRAAVRATGDRFFAEVGYSLYHVHFERDAGKPEEDVVHMRLGTLSLGAGMAF